MTDARARVKVRMLGQIEAAVMLTLTPQCRHNKTDQSLIASCLFAGCSLPANINTITEQVGAQLGGPTAAEQGVVFLAAVLTFMSKPVSQAALERETPTLPKRIVKKIILY